MATQDLNVKFKIDASDVTRGSEDAKNKVKNAANEMASDVKNSSQQMEASMKDVSRATEGIGEATKTATNAVKQMEGQVSSSASQMKKDIGDVATQIKNISVRQWGGIASRGLGIAGNATNWVADNFTEEGGTANTALHVGGGALAGAGQGVMLGAAFGPAGMAIGGAVGALAGAGAELFKAGKQLQEAAAQQSKARRDSFKDAVADLNARREADRVNKENQSFINDLGTAGGMDRYNAELEARTKAVSDAQKAYDDYVSEFAYLYDPKWTGEKSALTKEEEDQLNKLKDALETAKKSLESFAPVVDAAATAIEEQKKVVEPTEEEKRRTRYETAAQQAQEEDEMERMIRRLEAGRPATTIEEAEQIDDELAAAEEEQKKKDNSLKGAFSISGMRQTDSLTRIGGGNGYASYNNSTAQIQKNIETSLKTLISNQKNQNDQIIQKLDEFKNLDFTTTWE